MKLRNYRLALLRIAMALAINEFQRNHSQFELFDGLEIAGSKTKSIWNISGGIKVAGGTGARAQSRMSEISDIIDVTER
jgi:hypothetical protein